MERLWLPAVAIETMSAEAELWSPMETGGALMGYESEDGLVVTDLVGPGPGAARTPSSFTPDGSFQLAEIGRIYASSGRITTYIGDWHSHPNASPVYSVTDRAALREVADAPASRCDRPLMVILGTAPDWEAIAWRYRPGFWRTEVEAMTIEFY